MQETHKVKCSGVIKYSAILTECAWLFIFWSITWFFRLWTNRWVHLYYCWFISSVCMLRVTGFLLYRRAKKPHQSLSRRPSPGQLGPPTAASPLAGLVTPHHPPPLPLPPPLPSHSPQSLPRNTPSPTRHITQKQSSFNCRMTSLCLNHYRMPSNNSETTSAYLFSSVYIPAPVLLILPNLEVL